jgi:2-polyprenyl-6-methoxyphenol hydroxylase-like FAD-dependent oxidoreductase
MTENRPLDIDVLISGASIAGPALAFWLQRYGARVTVVEKAPALRPGGQAVDVKGDVHRTVLERMGILDELRAHETGGTDQTIIDAAGRAIAVLPGAFTGGTLEIRRGDLAAILHRHTRDTCEYVFGDAITSLTETADGVHVTFERGAPRTFDVVVGADGIHSGVRRLAFGPEERFVRHLGHHYALVELPDGHPFAGDPAVMYNEPGRMAALGGPKSPAFFVFAAGPLGYDRHSREEQRRVVLEAFAGGGWRLPELLAQVRVAPDVYVDSVSRVEMDRYAAGRAVLTGDAAYGNTLGGFGSGLALVAGYVLAGELAVAGGDHRRAFRAYEDRFRPYAAAGRTGNAGSFLAPTSRRGIWLRNLVFRARPVLGAMMWITDRFANRIELPDYAALLQRQEGAKRASCSGVSTSSGTARSPHSTSSRSGWPAR